MDILMDHFQWIQWTRPQVALHPPAAGSARGPGPARRRGCGSGPGTSHGEKGHVSPKIGVVWKRDPTPVDVLGGLFLEFSVNVVSFQWFALASVSCERGVHPRNRTERNCEGSSEVPTLCLGGPESQHRNKASRFDFASRSVGL